MKRMLVVLDFDGLLVNSYALIRETFTSFDLDVGDEGRFRNRRKFLKYFGGGKELLSNLAMFALPKKKRIREELTRHYLTAARVYECFVPFVNACIEEPGVHVGVVSRNFTLNPGATIRHVLAMSGVNEPDLDFVIPLSVGVKKTDVLEGMRSPRYRMNVLAGDEIGDYKAAVATGYTPLIAAYGFDDPARLRKRGGVPEATLCDTPEQLAAQLWRLARLYVDAPISSLPQQGGRGLPLATGSLMDNPVRQPLTGDVFPAS